VLVVAAGDELVRAALRARDEGAVRVGVGAGAATAHAPSATAANSAASAPADDLLGPRESVPGL